MLRWFHIQSTLVISNSTGLSEILRDIRTSTYQICKIEEKLIQLTTFNKYMCNWTLEVRDIFKYCGKKEKLLLRSNSSSFPQYFYMLLDFHVKAGTRFSLRDKQGRDNESQLYDVRFVIICSLPLLLLVHGEGSDCSISWVSSLLFLFLQIQLLTHLFIFITRSANFLAKTNKYAYSVISVRHFIEFCMETFEVFKLHSLGIKVSLLKCFIDYRND